MKKLQFDTKLVPAKEAVVPPTKPADVIQTIVSGAKPMRVPPGMLPKK